MATWLIFMQVILDLGLLLGLFVVWARLSRPQKEDARLSKGLQLLQSKISILEDLSDRTDVQVRQLSALLSAKAVEVHQKTAEADRQIQAIEKSMQKSLELSKIFQDKIPHKEIIERETSYKYIEAARMANQGLAADEISRKLEIPLGEVEVIINMNRDQLIFKEDDIPPWAQPSNSGRENSRVTAEWVAPTEAAIAPLKELGALSKELLDDTLVDFAHPVPEPTPAPVETPKAPELPPVPKEKAATGPEIKPYEFPRIDTKFRY